KRMERITVEYYRAGMPYLPPEAIEEIIQSRGTIKNACKEMVDKYSTSTRRIYEIWKRHAQGLPQRKQQMIQNNIPPKIISIPENDRQSKKRKSKSISNNIPNMGIVELIERETKRKDKLLASSSHITSA
ncbi:5126_t:CDS:1, partial [Dentiscutata heterogama]